MFAGPRARLVGWALASGLVGAVACRHEIPQEVALDTGGTAAIDYGECEPGEELPCTCSSGAAGTQLCLESGYERGPCLCGMPMPPADTGSSTETMGTGSGTAGTGTGGSSSSGTGLDSSGGG